MTKVFVVYHEKTIYVYIITIYNTFHTCKREMCINLPALGKGIKEYFGALQRSNFILLSIHKRKILILSNLAVNFIQISIYFLIPRPF